MLLGDTLHPEPNIDPSGAAITDTSGGANLSFTYGVAGDKPLVGDWDANGTDTIGIDWAGQFLLRNRNSTGPANLSFYLGVSGDDPIAGPWLTP